MRRLSVLVLLVTLLAVLVAPTAFAANPHFIGKVKFSDQGTTLNATGSIAGLGNEDITVVLDATGTALISCRNPGGNIAPGQNKEVDVSGSQENIQVKNGRANFNVTTLEPTLDPAEVCPNAQWTPILRDVRFSSATITVFQDGEQVLQETFTP